MKYFNYFLLIAFLLLNRCNDTRPKNQETPRPLNSYSPVENPIPTETPATVIVVDPNMVVVVCEGNSFAGIYFTMYPNGGFIFSLETLMSDGTYTFMGTWANRGDGIVITFTGDIPDLKALFEHEDGNDKIKILNDTEVFLPVNTKYVTIYNVACDVFYLQVEYPRKW